MALKISKTTIYTGLSALVIGLCLGGLLFGGGEGAEEHAHAESELINTTWTCSMHPQIRQEEPGQCPLCGMDLIPLTAGTGDENPMEIRMSPTAMQLANVQTSVITKQIPVKEVRMNGKVQADERYNYSQTSHITGRIEKLLVNYTGEYVRRGQVLAYIYSPELVTAQEELFEAFKNREGQPALYRAAREKLTNWKLTEKQIDEILAFGSPQENFPVLSDLSGVVLAKRVNLGDHIMGGSTLFEVANLSRVWVLFDMYESDMQWVKRGDIIDFNISSLPGESFSNKITFIDPVINPRTRTARARVEINNPGQRLKPEMFAQGTVMSPLSNEKEAVIVPKSSVMWTGERSVVYVKTSSAVEVGFMMREITLGPALGDSYLVIEGLEEGEEIATNGTFSIDAAAQLAGKPSMMNKEGGVNFTSHNHGDRALNDQGAMESGKINADGKAAIEELLIGYDLLKDALVSDNGQKAKEEAGKLKEKIGKTAMSLFGGEAHQPWMTFQEKVITALDKMESAGDITEVRTGFIAVSDQFVSLAKLFGPFGETLYVQFCPMTNENKGAQWISRVSEVRNPYYGAAMLKCGETISEIK